ncbi:glycosyltransferase family 2 protein [Actinomycetospora termitidis]|uniref:Glycosyltransferase family 2 protein n=1 Tax=Actinomycetospora termitidis TaxID=3053470 RepID=A0ABT7MHI7_9PSEU|nr:glycosyltransferase family 2 protein [Actinomycetospora sp. Odt1-22]MDL5160140.1 glycosyltransferase family 2 protein [Actinomycetospora sp. Odt1-22]
MPRTGGRPSGPTASVVLPQPRSGRRAGVIPRVSVVIPTLDEAANIGWVLDRIGGNVDEVVVVDGRSRDGTVAVARGCRPDVRIVEQPVPGKGAALALGLGLATGDIVVMMDGDGSMDPGEIPGLVGALLSGADVVKGSRAVAGGGSRDLSLLRWCGNRALTALTNGGYRLRWSELCYGYAALWSDVVPLLDLGGLGTPAGRDRAGHGYGHGFEIEALIFCRAARAALRVAEVPSTELPRLSGTSHLRPWRDGWRVLRTVLREASWSSTHPGPRREDRCYGVKPYPGRSPGAIEAAADPAPSS